MQKASWNWLFTWEGRVDRVPYFLAGTILTIVKYLIDHSVAARFGETWHIWSYFFPPLEVSLLELTSRQPKLYAILWAIAIPFFWIGISLTVRRLRDAGLRTVWIFLFFVPLANLALFLYLSFAPSRQQPTAEEIAADELRRTGKRSEATVGVLIAVLLGVGLAIFGSEVLLVYGWGLFLGVPFFVGFIASWFLNAKVMRSKLNTILVSGLTPFLIGTALLSLGREGLIVPAHGSPTRHPLVNCWRFGCSIHLAAAQIGCRATDLRRLHRHIAAHDARGVQRKT